MHLFSAPCIDRNKAQCGDVLVYAAVHVAAGIFGFVDQNDHIALGGCGFYTVAAHKGLWQ